MKKLLYFLLAMCLTPILHSQTEPGEPCCNVIAIDTRTNLVKLIDKNSGQLYQFKADPMDLNNIKNNDLVVVASGKIASVGGVKKTYSVLNPDYQEPCCAVVNIQPDPAQPCCSIVTYKNNITGETGQFQLPKNKTGPISMGDPVFAEPCCSMAVVKTTGPDGQIYSYGYASTAAPGGPTSTASGQKWELTPLKTKSNLGRLDLHFPAGVEWKMDLYTNTGKFIISRSYNEQILAANNNPYHELAPGIYSFRLNTVTVENVPIEAGKQTRLKSGVLDINNTQRWELRSEDSKKFHTSGNKTKKIALPAGKYQLGSGKTFTLVEVKDLSVKNN